MKLTDINWQTWTPVDVATLVFVMRGEEILLIRKKRGLGAGKINGPGGRLDPGETALQCAIREVQEELLITPLELSQIGELKFQFTDGYSIHGHVFRAEGHEGTPTETDEAIPLWTPINAIPFDEMWEDDRIWLPYLIDSRPFLGRFIFEKDDMLDFEFEVEGELIDQMATRSEASSKTH